MKLVLASLAPATASVVSVTGAVSAAKATVAGAT